MRKTVALQWRKHECISSTVLECPGQTVWLLWRHQRHRNLICSNGTFYRLSLDNVCPLSTVALEEIEHLKEPPAGAEVLMRARSSTGAGPRGMKPGEPKTTTSSSGELERKRKAWTFSSWVVQYSCRDTVKPHWQVV